MSKDIVFRLQTLAEMLNEIVDNTERRQTVADDAIHHIRQMHNGFVRILALDPPADIKRIAQEMVGDGTRANCVLVLDPLDGGVLMPLPPALVQHVGWREGDDVEVVVETPGQIVIRRPR